MATENAELDQPVVADNWNSRILIGGSVHVMHGGGIMSFNWKDPVSDENRSLRIFTKDFTNWIDSRPEAIRKLEKNYEH